VVVPCFSRPEMIEAWCGLPLSYSTLDGITVAKRIPENWWVVVNPGQEIEKELSPWEIEKLSQGSEAIPELLLDIVPENSIEPLTLLPVEEHEFVKLKQALANAAPQEPMLESIFLAKEQGLQEDGETIEQLLIGMAWNQGATPDLQGPFEHLIQTAMIGDSTYALYSSLTESGSMRIGMLRKFSPLYQRNEETKLRKIFNKLLG
ncbi:MAG: hypothetical protein KDD62_05020, partial [Bdellovibrionales bacterium]|nr:hypothetical protein [Bdellovibrionales bacterium]